MLTNNSKYAIKVAMWWIFLLLLAPWTFKAAEAYARWVWK